MYSVSDAAFARQFWERVVQSPEPDGCWLWTGPVNNRGYGHLTRARRHILAHRWAYEQTYGPIPPNLCVMHRCDVRGCVNPAHLTVGTHRENMADCARKGRTAPAAVHPRGEAHGRARLTEADVRDIRARFATGETCRQIAARYPVSRMNIVQIVYRRSWQHVD